MFSFQIVDSRPDLVANCVDAVNADETQLDS